MDIEKLKEFYEKLYFQETENKDKIYNRIQMIFGLIVIDATIVTYLLKNTSFENHAFFACIVIGLSLLSVFFIYKACMLLKKAFWGNEFKYIPKPKEIDEYYNDLIKYEADYKKYCDNNGLTYNGEHSSSKKFNEYLVKQLVECTSWNTKKNEMRTSQIYRATKFFFFSLIPLVIAVGFFLAMDLDSASPRKTNEPHFIIIPVDNIRRL